jgi:FkbM family methyltransferase
MDIKPGQHIAILGSGEVGRGIFVELKRVFGSEIFIDIGDSNSGRVGKFILGNKVFSIDELERSNYDLLIMGFCATDAVYKEARKSLGERFSCDIVSASDVFISYPGIRGWPLLAQELAVSRKADADFIISRFSDVESVIQYESYYRWVCKEPAALPPEGEHDSQYFDKKIIKLIESEVFVDCGAFCGDTLNIFLKETNGVFEEYYAFEPDEKNFSKMVAYVATLEFDFRRRIKLFNQAIAGHAGYIGFSGDESQFSHQDAVSENWVLATSVEAFNFRKTPTFIKFDLEGCDLKALMGSIHKIVEIRPVLCVAIYHNPEDFLDIPLFLIAALKDYQFYVRAHNKFGFDFVLYCVPEGRSL